MHFTDALYEIYSLTVALISCMHYKDAHTTVQGTVWGGGGEFHRKCHNVPTVHIRQIIKQSVRHPDRWVGR